MKKYMSIFSRISLPVISFLLLTLVLSGVSNTPVQATQQDACNTITTYEKTSDYSDSRVNINFESNDYQIDVSAQSGYQITEVALDVSNDGHSGYYVYATGTVNNFNPNPGDEINEARVKVKKVCTTPTPTVFVPTPTVVIPTPTIPYPTVNPCDGQCVTPTPTMYVYPTETPCQAECCGECGNIYITPTINPCDGQCVTPTPTVTVAPTTTPEPTATPVPGQGLTHTEGNSGDGRGDGSSSCPSCTSNPTSTHADTNGQVLGLASTGVFTDNVMNAILMLGIACTSLSIRKNHGIKKS